MVMKSLFRKRILYENGNVNSYNKTNYMQTGAFSQTTKGTVGGAISNMYDYDTTTLYQFSEGAGAVAWLKWDFKKKVKFRTIYIYAKHNAAAGKYTRLQGSNDNTNWTDLAILATTGAEVFFNMIATDVNYRYIRFIADDAVTFACQVHTIIGVI